MSSACPPPPRAASASAARPGGLVRRAHLSGWRFGRQIELTDEIIKVVFRQVIIVIVIVVAACCLAAHICIFECLPAPLPLAELAVLCAKCADIRNG